MVLNDEADLSVTLNATPIYEAGSPVEFDAEALSASIRDRRDTDIRLVFSLGSAGCRFWTSDLTAEYVKLNADYHT